ncbi:MAG: penicillin-binding protein [Bifidobacteriaceae bacterium]|jgi:membrane peptidoglycan carboxypeptidase|nr:penicillin-binding protein [Bifidobacteriaceae bacterium]
MAKTSKSKKKKRKGLFTFFKVLFSFILTLGIASFIFFIVSYNQTQIPEPDAVALEQRSTVYFSDGITPVGSLSDQNRAIIDCSALPAYVGNAIVASEDRTFWSNSGIDPIGIIRAFINNISGGSRQGGSTISQQYAERYYMGENDDYYSKFKEALLAVKLNASQNKNEILCNYMNTIYFGRNSYGIQAAAEAYFGKDAASLTVSEASLLAGVIPSPNNWDPNISKESGQKRWERTLNLMANDNYISKEELNTILKIGLPKTRTQMDQPFAGTNGYIMQIVKDYLINEQKIPLNDILSGGYKITTTINKSYQDAIISAAKTLPSDASPNSQIGAAVLDNKSGDILAFWGGPDNLKHSLNNAIQAKAQAGSTFKPFTLLGAAEKRFDFNKLYNGNSPQKFNGLKNPVSNADDVSYGMINLYKGLANSVNTVFVKLNQEIGPEITSENVNKAGIDESVEPTLLNTLGFTSVTPLELARGFNTFANSGCRNNPYFIQSITHNSKSIYNATPSCEQVFDKADVEKVDAAMQGVVQNGFAQRAKSLGETIAGKSGTSSDNKSAWFAGYNAAQTAVFGLWQTGADGSEETISPFGGAYGNAGSGWTLDAFIHYMTQIKADDKK